MGQISMEIVPPNGGADQNLDRLCRNAESLAVFEGTKRAKGYFDALLIVPMDIGINFFYELLDRGRLPVPRVKEFRFQPAEEAFACSVILRAPLAGH